MLGFLSRHVLTIIIGVVLLAVGWYLLSGSKPKAGELVTTVVADKGSVEGNIVDTLLTLKAVSLSGTIFSDPAFASLLDVGTQIVPEPVGRPNPFAPRGVGVTSTPQSATTTGTR